MYRLWRLCSQECLIRTDERLILKTREAWRGLGRPPSASEVARRAGVSRATVYRYFPSRRALLDAARVSGLPPEEDRRSGILEAALRLFTRRGFHATSMDEVAEEAGVSKGAIYGHFRSKAELFRGLVAHLGLLPRLQRIAAQAPRRPGLEGLREFTGLALEFGRLRRDAMRMLICELQHFPELRRLMSTQVVAPGLRSFQGIIEAEQGAGRLRRVPARQAAVGWISLLMGFNLLRATFGRELEVEEEGLAETFFEMLTRGLVTEEAP